MEINRASGIQAYKKNSSTEKINKESVEVTKDLEKDVENDSGVVYDKLTISELKAESDKAYEGLRKIVEDMLKRQGYSFKDIEAFEGQEITIDKKAVEESKKMIEGDGPYSPESVSNRIVKFAKAISGGDKSKLDLIKSAIEDGFKQAEKAFGGKLPEISKETHDLIMEKLDGWENEENLSQD